MHLYKILSCICIIYSKHFLFVCLPQWWKDFERLLFDWLIDFGFEARSHLTPISFAQLKPDLELRIRLLYVPNTEIAYVPKI